MSIEIVCPACESTKCTQQQRVDFFPYGIDPKKRVVLNATVPMMNCSECGLDWTDERGEDARAAAVTAHIRTQKERRRG